MIGTKEKYREQKIYDILVLDSQDIINKGRAVPSDFIARPNG